MQITFDPLNETEAAYVRDMLGTSVTYSTSGPTIAQIMSEGALLDDINASKVAALVESPAAVRAEVAATIAQADQPDTGADAPSGTPLEQDAYLTGITNRDAPLPAAADLFGTAPVAPPAGEASIVPPPPVPSVPPAAAPSASVLPVLPAGAVDKHGLPWDDRIHSGTRVKNADGSWRQRRGVDAELVKTVENELRALMALPTRPGITLGSAGPFVPVAPPVPVPANSSNTTGAAPVSAPTVMAPAGAIRIVAVGPTDVESAGELGAKPATEGNVPPPPVPAPPTSAPATAPIPSPPPVAAPTAAEPAAPLTFATMLRKVTDALAQNKIKETDVHAALEQVGLLPTQIGLLSARADLLPAFDMHIAAAIGAGHA